MFSPPNEEPQSARAEGAHAARVAGSRYYGSLSPEGARSARAALLPDLKWALISMHIRMGAYERGPVISSLTTRV